MIINQVEKKVRLDRAGIIYFQLMVYCHMNKVHISDHDLSCLTLLGMSGKQTLEDFCTLCKVNNIFSSNQSARNALSKAEKKGLILKEGRNKKKIYLSPSMNIQTLGNILLDYRIVHLEPVYESQES